MDLQDSLSVGVPGGCSGPSDSTGAKEKSSGQFSTSNLVDLQFVKFQPLVSILD